MKADEKAEIEEGTKEKFTNFEYLKVEVEVLKEQFDEIVDILKDNNLEKKEFVEPKYFDDEKVFERLGNEE